MSGAAIQVFSSTLRVLDCSTYVRRSKGGKADERSVFAGLGMCIMLLATIIYTIVFATSEVKQTGVMMIFALTRSLQLVFASMKLFLQIPKTTIQILT